MGGLPFAPPSIFSALHLVLRQSVLEAVMAGEMHALVTRLSGELPDRHVRFVGRGKESSRLPSSFEPKFKIVRIRLEVLGSSRVSSRSRPSAVWSSCWQQCQGPVRLPDYQAFYASMAIDTQQPRQSHRFVDGTDIESAPPRKTSSRMTRSTIRSATPPLSAVSTHSSSGPFVESVEQPAQSGRPLRDCAPSASAGACSYGI